MEGDTMRQDELLAKVTAERDRLALELAELQAEHETTLRKLDAARAEIARAASCQVSPQ